MSEMASGLRCAIYTRKSTEEGLEQEFNTLQAQRESAEAYIASQRLSGWSVAGGALRRRRLQRGEPRPSGAVAAAGGGGSRAASIAWWCTR